MSHEHLNLHRNHTSLTDTIPDIGPADAPTGITRRLSGVLAADVIGYTTLMEDNEEDTHARLSRLRSGLIDPTVIGYGGRVVKNTGDGFLASFGTASDAVRCAVYLQKRLLDIAAGFPSDRRILFRMGLNYCDTIVDGADIYGEGVNIAARLMTYAEPGDIVLTKGLSRLVKGELQTLPTFDMGELHLKNIKRPMHGIGVRIGSSGLLAAPMLRGAPDARPSIAVLPFRAQLANASDLLSAEGIVEEITHALAREKELFVVSRGSTFRFTPDQIDTAAIGQALGVQYLLQGSIRRMDERVRVQTELSEAATGQIICSDRHDGSIGDLSRLESLIALSATKSIAPRIQEWELRRATRKHPESLTAYDLVLKARQQIYRLDHGSHARARGLLQQAIVLDPSYGPSYSCLAYWHTFRVIESISPDPEADAVEAARCARMAIECDEHDALARAIYGHVQSFFFRDYDSAQVHFERALDDNPNCAEAWAMSSITYGFLGESSIAVKHAAQGLRLSPLDAHICHKEAILAQAHYINEDFEAAVAWARRAQTHNSRPMYNDRVLAASLSALGRTAEARRVGVSLLQRASNFRLEDYRRRCPFHGTNLNTWIDRLREAGLPD